MKPIKATIALKAAEYALVMTRENLLLGIFHSRTLPAGHAALIASALKAMDAALMEPSRSRVLAESSLLYRVNIKAFLRRALRKAA